jgi:hypothetical protein
MRRTCSRSAADDQEPVKTLRSDGTDEAFGVGVGLWRANGRVDHPDPFAPEHLVKGCSEFAVAIVDQEAHPLEQAAEAEVARLLNDPPCGRVRGATCQVDAAPAELDEEEDVQPAQRDRLDGEEVAGEHARGLPAKERRPAQRCAPRRRLEPCADEQAPDLLGEMRKPSLIRSPAIR